MSGREGKLTLLVSSTSLESNEGAADDLGYPVDAMSEVEGSARGEVMVRDQAVFAPLFLTLYSLSSTSINSHKESIGSNRILSLALDTLTRYQTVSLSFPSPRFSFLPFSLSS